MPNLPFNTEDDLGIVRERLKSYASVKTYYDSPSVWKRNKFIASRLVITNIEYLRFIKNLSAEESQIHAASDILILSLDIVSRAVSPAATKTILSGISSITGGSRLAIDKNAYKEKTMTALVSVMNAQRKEVLNRILKGTGLDLNRYPFEQALSDINEYYLAGTINGAMSTIQQESAAKELKNETEIRTFMENRSVAFADVEVQSRVDALLDKIDYLEVSELYSLNTSPPVTDPYTEKVVSARDPHNRRVHYREDAISILKMRIILSKRDTESLMAWEAAIASSIKVDSKGD